MKLREAHYNEAEEPARLTVELTAEEARLIYGFIGYTSPKAVTGRVGIEWGNLLSDLGSDLGSIGARLFEEGWDAPNLGLRTEEQ